MTGPENGVFGNVQNRSAGVIVGTSKAGLLRRIYISAVKKLGPRTWTVNDLVFNTDKSEVSRTVRVALYKKQYEHNECELILRHLKPEDRVAEFGGGIGFISLNCQKVVGPENVFTYEPNPSAVTQIRRNYELNNLTPNIIQAAVGAEDGETVFNVHENIISSSLLSRENTRPIDVTVQGVRRVLDERDPTVLVVDIEGAELDVLPLVENSNVRGICLELHPHIYGEEKKRELLEKMAAIGFREIDASSDDVIWLDRELS